MTIMKKILLIMAMVSCLIFNTFAQNYTLTDSLSGKEIKGGKIRVYEDFESSNKKMENQFLQEFVGKTNSANVNVEIKGASSKGIVYFKVSHPDYFEKKIVKAKIKNNTIELIRNRINDEYCIKLVTLKKEIAPDELVKMKSLFDVERIDLIKRTDGRFAYVTAPIKNLYKCNDQLERLKSTNNKMVQDTYLLHGEDKTPIFFRVQLKVARTWMEDELRNLKNTLDKSYSLDQIKSEDNLYRVVSEMKYNNYLSALKDYSEKARTKLFKYDVKIIACTKKGEKEVVLTTMKL
jgi:hypothetical protein